nr:MAG TPA: hypothetical protein [Bacteriophage sp.]
MNKVKAPIKEDFVGSVGIIDYMLDKFKEELQRCDSSYEIDGKYHRNTRKSKLNMYRKVINDELLLIENNYGANCYSGEYVPIEECKND